MPTYIHPSGKKIVSEKSLSKEQLEEAFGIVGSSISKSPEFDFGLALKNLGSGALEKLMDLVNPNTYIGIANLAKEVLPTMTPFGTATSLAQREDPTKAFKAVAIGIGNDLLNKYGSWQKIKSTFQDTPIEPVIDASMVLTGGGMTVSKIPGTVGKIGKVTTGVGMAMDPFNVATTPFKAVKWASAGVLNKVNQRLYDSALKISSKLDIGEIKRTAQRGLDSGIMPTEKGLKLLKTDMDKIGKQIEDVIAKGGKKGEYLDSWKIADKIDDIKGKFSNKVFHDPELDSVLDDLKMAFIELHGEKIPVQQAQMIKRTTQHHLAKAYDKLSAIKIEAEKMLTAQIRKELELKYPELTTLNPKQQANVWLNDAIENAIKTQSKAQLLPGISFFNVFKNKTLDNPLLKSRLGITLDWIRRRKAFSPTMTLGREAIVYQGKNPMEEAMEYLKKQGFQ